jgi:hypothetical protein
MTLKERLALYATSRPVGMASVAADALARIEELEATLERVRGLKRYNPDFIYETTTLTEGGPVMIENDKGGWVCLADLDLALSGGKEPKP